MREQKIYRWAGGIAMLVIVAVLLSGWQKVLHPAEFALAVYRYRLLPDVLVNLVALFIPWLEMVCAICLLFIPKYRRPALWLVLMLLLAFTAGVGIALVRGASIGCGCFSLSPMARPMTWFHVARNAGLVLLTVCPLVAERRGQA